jgi:hypothetical protein
VLLATQAEPMEARGEKLRMQTMQAGLPRRGLVDRYAPQREGGCQAGRQGQLGEVPTHGDTMSNLSLVL